LTEGWHGWDEYAPFYDWENARTLGRRDVPFWTSVAKQARGRVLELGCGTGRVSKPLIDAGVDLVGIDRSAAMLARFRSAEASRSKCIRGDIRALPFADESFAAVIAPYGILQSLTRDRDLAATLGSVARVTKRGGLLGIDLVPDVPNWREYQDREQLRGRDGARHLTLIESVHQNRRRRQTRFTQTYIERRGAKETTHRFDLVFRTLTVPQMIDRLERAGFGVDRLLGDYRGRAWDPRAEVWILLAKKG
jgi:SAM-dependent methyltransferase